MKRSCLSPYCESPPSSICSDAKRMKTEASSNDCESSSYSECLARVNNHAVSLLERGNPEAAVDVLRLPLNELLASRETDWSTLPSFHSGKENHSVSSPQEEEKKPLEIHNLVDTNSDEDDFTVMYNKAFCIPNEDARAAHTHTLAIVMSYNMALALHRQGIYETGKLEPALQLYETCLSLVRAGGDRFLTIFHLDHVHMALMNNMADINLQLIQNDQAECLFERLQIYLAMVSHNQATNDLQQDMGDYEFFEINSKCHHESSHLNIAPAA